MTYLHGQKEAFRSTLLHSKSQHIKTIEVDVQRIYANCPGFEWKENNTELLINGKYFEVLEVVRQNDLFIIKVIEDSRENELTEKFLNQHEGQNEDFLILLSQILNFACPADLNDIRIQSLYGQSQKYLNVDLSAVTGVYATLLKPPTRG
jgi:hypothetical protein